MTEASASRSTFRAWMASGTAALLTVTLLAAPAGAEQQGPEPFPSAADNALLVLTTRDLGTNPSVVRSGVNSPVSFDAAYSSDASLMAGLTHRTLTSYSGLEGAAGAQVVPDLATTLGTQNGSVWSFTLRTGIFWSDGSAITCADIQRGFKRDMEINAEGYAAGLLLGRAATASDLTSVNTKVACNGRIVTITLAAAEPALPMYLANPSLAPVHSSATGTTEVAFPTVTSGPYKAGTSSATRMTLIRNTNWSSITDPNRAALPDTIMITNEVSSPYDALQVDAYPNAVMLESISAAAASNRIWDGRARLGVAPGITPRTAYISPLTIPCLAVRRAIQYAFDRAALLESLNLPVPIADSIVSPAMPYGYRSSSFIAPELAETANLDLARQYMAQAQADSSCATSYAKATTGSGLVIRGINGVFPNNPDGSPSPGRETLRKSLLEAGIVAGVYRGGDLSNADVAIFSIVSPVPEPISILTSIGQNPATDFASDTTGYADYTAALARAKATADPVEVDDAVADAADVAIDRGWILPLFGFPVTVAAGSAIRNFYNGPVGTSPTFANVEVVAPGLCPVSNFPEDVSGTQVSGQLFAGTSGPAAGVVAFFGDDGGTVCTVAADDGTFSLTIPDFFPTKGRIVASGMPDSTNGSGWTLWSGATQIEINIGSSTGLSVLPGLAMNDAATRFPVRSHFGVVCGNTPEVGESCGLVLPYDGFGEPWSARVAGTVTEVMSMRFSAFGEGLFEGNAAVVSSPAEITLYPAQQRPQGPQVFNSCDSDKGGGSQPPLLTGQVRVASQVEYVRLGATITNFTEEKGWRSENFGQTGTNDGTYRLCPWVPASQIQTNIGALSATENALWFHGNNDERSKAYVDYISTLESNFEDCFFEMGGCANIDIDFPSTSIANFNVTLPNGDPAEGFFEIQQMIYRDSQLVGQAYLGSWEYKGALALSGRMPEGRYRLTFQVFDDKLGIAPKRVTMDVASDGSATLVGIDLVQGAYPIPMVTANVRGTLVAPDLSPVEWTGLEITPIDAEGNVDGSREGNWTNSREQGHFALNLEEGAWRITARPWGRSDVVRTSATVTIGTNGEFVSATGGLAYDSDATSYPYTFTLSGPNTVMRVVTIDGSTTTPVERAYVDLAPWYVESETKRYFRWGQGGGGESTAQGTVAVSLTDGYYQVVVNPPPGSDSVRTEQVMLFDFDGDTLVSVKACANSEFDYQQGMCREGTLDEVTLVDGAIQLVLKGANFEADICAPGETCTGVAGSWVEVQRITVNPNGGLNWTWIGGSVSDFNGKARFAVEDGDYRFSPRLPWNRTEEMNSWSEASYFVRVSSNGTVFSLCNGPANDPCSSTTTFSGAFYFKAANVSGTVVDDSAGVGQVWVEVFRNTEECQGCREWISGTSTNASVSNAGQFRLNLEDGTYTIALNPPYERGELARTEFTVVIDGGKLFSSSIGTIDEDGNLTVEISGANVKGRILDPSSSPAGDVGINVERKVGDGYEWYPAWANTKFTGEFSLSLPDGDYRLRFFPRSAGAVATSAVINVSGETLTCVSGCTVSMVSGKIELTLPGPNLEGSVGYADESDPLVTLPLAYAWIGVDIWDQTFQNYRWTADVTGANTSSTGEFGVNLPEGRWRLTIWPPFNPAGLVKKTVEVVVEADGTICLLSGSTDGVCADQTKSSLDLGDLSLTRGNLSGTVLADGAAANGGWVNVETYDVASGYWRWIDQFSNVSQGTLASRGKFSLDLTTAGTYRLTVNPPGGSSDFGRTYAYVLVYDDGGEMKACEISKAKATTGATSADCLAAAGSISVALEGANVTGTISSSTGVLRDAWVSVLQELPNGGREWVTGAGTNSTGKFALSLAAGNYIVEIFPPWSNNGGLTRQVRKITVAEGVPFVLSVTLTQGNLTGDVREPSIGALVPQSNIQVERWVKAPWDPNQQLYYWEWFDAGVISSSTGTFSGNLDASGIYRLTAWPSPNTPTLTRARKIINVTVDGELTWCELGASTVNVVADANPFGSCAEVPASGSISVMLRGSNLTGTVTNGGQGVRDAWINVIRVQDGASGEGIPAGGNYVWEWIDGVNSRSFGAFSANITQNGTYRFEFNPPWQGSDAALPRFSKILTVSGCDAEGVGCVISEGGSELISASGVYSWSTAFPSANVVAKVCDAYDLSGCTGVSRSWVSVAKLVDDGGGNFREEWTDKGANTDASGTFRLRLEDESGNDSGTVYRLEAYPSWSDPRGLQTTKYIKVCGTEVTEVVTADRAVLTGNSGCAGSSPFSQITLVKPNAAVSVVNGLKAVGGAWVEAIKNTGEWVTGGSTNRSGSTSLYLADLPVDGFYLLRAFPNGVVSKAPVQVKVVMENGAVKEWFYCTSLALDADCTEAGTGEVALDFDHVTPNVTITSDLAGYFIAVYSCNNVGCETETLSTDFTAVTDANGSAKLVLPNGFWRLKLVPKSAEDLNWVATFELSAESGPASITWITP